MTDEGSRQDRGRRFRRRRLANQGTMTYEITAKSGYLRAELFDRETVEETQSFLRAVVRENTKHRRACALILVRMSKPIFQVAAHRLIEYIGELSRTSARRIALVGDSSDLRMSHEYIELLARQRGLDVRSFRDEGAALRWLGSGLGEDRRQRQERRVPHDRRRLGERRLQERRAAYLQPA
jgi:hypothetical protein